MIAALYVKRRGAYFAAADIDPWDKRRDARGYRGPHPVVAHPPCARWCRLAPQIQAMYGHRIGDDGGCFAAALEAVRAFGGVLEHPAFSYAWPAFGLPRPPSSGGWVRGECGGYACHVEQGHYGHRARKATWLYVVGASLPDLVWGKATGKAWCTPGASAEARRGRDDVGKMGDGERLATPAAFRDVLISIARSVPARQLEAS